MIIHFNLPLLLLLFFSLLLLRTAFYNMLYPLTFELGCIVVSYCDLLVLRDLRQVQKKVLQVILLVD
ncbi:MAG: hypothetical protein ACI90V_003119 [Bacillariaceae sp.]|jgi:hypothetical protein